MRAGSATRGGWRLDGDLLAAGHGGIRGLSLPAGRHGRLRQDQPPGGGEDDGAGGAVGDGGGVRAGIGGFDGIGPLKEG